MGSLNLDTALNALLKFRNRSGRTYGTFSMENR